MLSKKERHELAEILSKQPVDGLNPKLKGDCVVFKVEELSWIFKISRYGTVDMKIEENGNILKEKLYGFYPLAKDPSEMIRQWKTFVTRELGGSNSSK